MIRHLTALFIVLVVVVVAAGCGSTTTVTSTALATSTTTVATTTATPVITTTAASTTLATTTTTATPVTSTTLATTTTAGNPAISKFAKPGNWQGEFLYATVSSAFAVEAVTVVSDRPDFLELYFRLGGVDWHFMVGEGLPAVGAGGGIDPTGDDVNEALSKFTDKEVDELYKYLDSHMTVEVK